MYKYEDIIDYEYTWEDFHVLISKVHLSDGNELEIESDHHPLLEEGVIDGLEEYIERR